MRFIQFLLVLSLLLAPINSRAGDYSTPYGGYILQLLAKNNGHIEIMSIAKFNDPQWGIYQCAVEKKNIENWLKNNPKHDILVVCAQYRQEEL